jgi:PhnB protein
MPEHSLIDQLEQAVQALLAGSDAEQLRPELDPSLAPLMPIAEELRDLPRENFKARFKSDLERKASMASPTEKVAAALQTATPRLRIKNAAAAIEFYKKAFGAREIMRFIAHGEIAQAEIAIGNSVIMLGEESLEYGYPGPETLGGSPVSIHLYVEDVDAFVNQAVAAGAKLIAPVQDKFYGDRSGTVADPFGYTWGIATRKIDMSLEEMHRSFEALEQQPEPKKSTVDPVPKGYRTLTSYLIAQDAPGLIDFVRQTFDAEETFRTVGSAGGIHAEVRLGDSMLMIGGGGPGLSWRGEGQPMAFHVYVKDTDSTYQRALDAGAVSMQAPADQPWGERTANVKDPSGNHWYIATFKGENYFSEGAPTVQPYLHPLRAEPVINFLKRAFGAKEMGRYTSPDGVIRHTTLKIGDAAMEMTEAEGPYQPMPSMFYLYVPNVDAVYRRALDAGATSTGEPADQSYGDRTASVKDVFGNQWYIATHIRDVTP